MTTITIYEDGADRRMTGAEFAARRHILGYTLAEIADVLHVNPRTVRAWESGRDLIPQRIGAELTELIAEHTAMTRRMLEAGTPISIVRNRRDRIAGDQPRGWHVAAAARAIAEEPDLMVDWI